MEILEPGAAEVLNLVRVAALLLGATALGDRRAIRLLLPGVAFAVLGLLLHDLSRTSNPVRGFAITGKGYDYAV